MGTSLQDGRLTKLFGFNFIHSERLLAFNGTDDDAGTATPLLAWAKSGVYFGSWAETDARVVERNDLKEYPWQTSLSATFGATRLQEKKVIKVWARY